MPTNGLFDSELPHLEFSREPEWVFDRRRRRGFGSKVTPPQNRTEHANALGSSIEGALESLSAISEDLGIDPAKLLILELACLALDAEEILKDRYGASVVHEYRIKVNRTNQFHMLVQFNSVDNLNAFRAELLLYASGSQERGSQPLAERNSLFDGIIDIRRPAKEDRIGPRIATEGLPSTGQFYLDVDLWHPGIQSLAHQLLSSFEATCVQEGAEIKDRLVTSSLILVKVLASPELANRIIDLPIVARVDLPPRLLAPYLNLFGDSSHEVPQLSAPTQSDPLVTVIDSGVIAGHPLLMNWVVEERDFIDSEDSETDDHGHGTAVSSLIVHESIADSLVSKIWRPRVRICSAKILRKHPVSGNAEFPEDHRIEVVVEDAIRYFHSERHCRIFNISIEREPETAQFAHGRQYPWAQRLDELARELDIVIIVLAGNAVPPIPTQGHTRDDLQREVRDNMNGDSYRISNPGTASLAITVGSIARSAAVGPDDPQMNTHAIASAVSASPAGAPSPFSRIGPGYCIDETNGAIKPDVVHFGGNMAVRRLAGGPLSWTNNHAFLGEPTAKFDFSAGRFITGQAGTSYACPHISHGAAIASVSLESALGRPPSANLIRATIGNATRVPDCGEEWFPNEETRIKLIGNGFCDLSEISWSHPNSVRLISEDSIEDDKLIVYQIGIPPSFLLARGRRGMSISLAYDPPVRATRRAYLARTLWFEVLHGLSLDEIASFRASPRNDSEPVRLPQSAILEFRPTKSQVEWSTLQVRKRAWSQRPRLRTAHGEMNPTVHVLVGSQQRFEVLDNTPQRFGLVVHFWHSDSRIDLYQELRARVRVPAARIRV